MLTNPTLDHMQMLGLSGMAIAWRELAEQPESRSMDKDEWLGLMLDREIAVRADKRLTARLAAAKLRFAEACVEDIDFYAARNLDRRATMALAQGRWLKNHENLIVTGKTGTENRGLHVHWHVRRPAMTIAFFTLVRLGSLRNWPWPSLMVVIRNS